MSVVDITDILKILPHRYPMLLVDRIIECDDQKRIVGIKNLTFNEPQFQGHFPNRPIMPGVLQLEAMAQVGGVLLSRATGIEGRIPLFMAIDKARFRQVLEPGDQMRIEVELTNLRTKIARMNGKVLCNGKVASEAELMFMFTDEKTQS